MARSGLIPSLLLAAFAVGCSAERGADHGRRPNLLLITVDTVRADHLDLYGYERKTSPNLVRLAADGVVFERAWSQASWTLPSLASLHTSLYPSQHDVRLKNSRIGDGIVTIAEVLRDAGYRTAAVSSHWFAGSDYGFSKGFDHFDESQIRGHGAQTSYDINSIATGILADFVAEASDAPFFLWLHYFDPHFSYLRHPEFEFASPYSGGLGSRIHFRQLKSLHANETFTATDIEFAMAVYDEEVAHFDSAVGELLGELARLDLVDGTTIFVTADHGEAFMEHGHFFHGRDVYEELIRVPLLIGGAIPDSLRGRRVASRVEVASLPATLAEIAGVRDSKFRGDSLLEVARSGVTARYVISEGSRAKSSRERTIAVGRGDWKLILRLDDGEYELYDLSTDPGEQRNRFGDAEAAVAAVRGELLARLDQHRALPGVGDAAESIELNEQQQRHLHELGYIE